MSDTISITGLGIICAIGNDQESVLSSLRNGRSGIGEIKYLETRHRHLPVGEVKLSNEQMKQMLGVESSLTISRTALMGAIAIRQALAQAGVGEFDGRRVALISGTTVGDMDVNELYFEKMLREESLDYPPQGNECGKSSVEMAKLAGIDGAQICTISTACSSALNSIILGSEMLRRGEADIVIAGGSEALSRFHLNGFNTLMILDKERCRPFDSERAGLNLGEGAGFVVLEKGTSKRTLAYVAGYGNRCDAFHQTASSENGEGAYLAMSDAIAMAGIATSKIGYVNAHGTGTPNNDISESQALKRVFGENMPYVSSTKSFTGHTTSASGSIETIVCVLAMQHGFVPANLGWANQTDEAITPTLGKDDVSLEYVLCNSFGFGGNDSSLVLSASESMSSYNSEREYASEIVADEEICSSEELSALREYMSSLETRRMGKLMKAAHLSALRAMQKAGITCPDAIVTATSRGMLDISMQFLEDISKNGEELLKPTLFMQSTHNTISSAIAIRTKCYGYNITYSQGDESMRWAMRDAERLVAQGKVESVLIVEFDEATPMIIEYARQNNLAVPRELYARSIVLKRK